MLSTPLISAFTAAAVLVVLVGLGFWRSRRARHPVAVASQPMGAHT
jgi:MYXO-CTERM domain-containing protein